jgi:N-acetylmuramoyl-L-alanine amidase
VRRLAAALLLLIAPLLMAVDGPVPASPDTVAALAVGRPALSVETLEFLPGQGRASRSYLLYRFADEDEAYLDLWDAVQILQANRYFDPVTRKVALGVGGHRVKLTDGSAWTFHDGRPRELGAPCRIAAGRFYLPLSFWPVLLDELADLPLRRDPDALRLVGGLLGVNVLKVEWIYAGDRLRGVFQLSEALAPELTRLGERTLRIHFPGGRLAPRDWDRLPGLAPVDSLLVNEQDEGISLTLHFRRSIEAVRSAADPAALTWAFTADLPAAASSMQPEFAGELAERLPTGAASDRRLSRVILDPGHGGRDLGAVSGGKHEEKAWNLRLARWLEPHLTAEGFQVIWTRKGDIHRRPADRVQAANISDCDLFLSLHFTRRGVEGERGLEIILEEAAASGSGVGSLQPWAAVQARHAESSLELAAGIQHSLDVLTGWPQLGIRRESTAQLEGLDMPALLLELGNLDSPAERMAWEDGPTRDKRLQTLARALAYRARRWSGDGGQP